MTTKFRKLFGKIIGKRPNAEVTADEPPKKKKGNGEQASNAINMEVHITKMYTEVKTVQWKVEGFSDILDEDAIVKQCCDGCTFSAGATLGCDSDWKVNLKIQGKETDNAGNKVQDHLVLVLAQVGPQGPDQSQPLLNKIRIKIGTPETNSLFDKTLSLTRVLPTESQGWIGWTELVSMEYLKDPSHGLISEEGTLTLQIEITLCSFKTYVEPPVVPAASPSLPSSPSDASQVQPQERSSMLQALAEISGFMSGESGLASGDNTTLADAYLVSSDKIRFPVHKAVLAARSPIFRSIFVPRVAQGSGGDPAPTSGCPNGNNPDDSDDDDDAMNNASKELEEYSVLLSSAALSVILLYIYTGQLKEEWAKLSLEKLKEVISAALEFHLVPLTNFLDTAIAACVTKDNFEILIQLTEIFNLTSTLEALKKMRSQ